MTNSILFPKEIYNRLSKNKDITNIVQNRIYPIIGDNSVKIPFIVYTKDDVTNITTTKDGYSEDSLDFTIFIVSDKYSTSLELANYTRETFEHKRLNCNDFIVTDCVMTGIRESFEENSYLQVVSFNCRIINA